LPTRGALTVGIKSSSSTARAPPVASLLTFRYARFQDTPNHPITQGGSCW
jgi:hypothetical protein